MPTIRFERVEKLYKGSNRKWPAVLTVNLRIEQGEFVFFAGKRGCGTSVVLKMITGELPPDKGIVFLGHSDIAKAGKRKQKRIEASFGKVHQISELPREGTVFGCFCPDGRDNTLQAAMVSRPRVKKALALVGMSGSERKKIEDLSPSDLRRIEVARAIFSSPPILVVDDFSDQVDDECLWDIVNLLRELNRRGTTVIMAAHSGKIVNIVRPRVIMLADGKVISDNRQGRFGETVVL